MDRVVALDAPGEFMGKDRLREVAASPPNRFKTLRVDGDMLTKYGMSAWSCQPPALPFESLDVSGMARAATTTASVDANYHGPARVASYTVAYDKGMPVQGIVIADTPGGQRCLATSSDADLIADMVRRLQRDVIEPSMTNLVILDFWA